MERDITNTIENVLKDNGIFNASVISMEGISQFKHAIKECLFILLIPSNMVVTEIATQLHLYLTDITMID